MHITEAKKRLRKDINERIARMTDEQRHAEGRTLCRILLKELPSPVTLCAYFPLKNEADIRPLLKTLIERGDSVFLPRFENESLVFRRAEDFSDLPPGELSIPEPPISAEELNPTDLDIVLVPGRAFDTAGGRLGRGSGGFDQWIEKQRAVNPKTQFWGTCLECQVVREVPTEEHDARMDAVVTARGIQSTITDQ